MEEKTNFKIAQVKWRLSKVKYYPEIHHSLNQFPASTFHSYACSLPTMKIIMDIFAVSVNK